MTMPDIPDLTRAKDRDLRIWLGRTKTARRERDLPYGVTLTPSRTYQARIRLAGVHHSLGTHADIAHAAHVVEVALRHWVAALRAEMERRGMDQDELELPDVQEVSDRKLAAWYRGAKCLACVPSREHGAWVARITLGNGLRWFGRFQERERAAAILQKVRDKWISALRAEMQRRIDESRNAQEDEDVGLDPYE